jgi:type II secretory pathway component GspD/PulD (secretin)
MQLDVKDDAKHSKQSRDNSSGARVIDVKEGSAATLADAIQRALERMRTNPVTVIKPADPNAKPPEKARKNKAGPEIVIVALKGKLLVACDDPELLKLVVEIARLHTATDSSTFTEFRLKSVRAIRASELLDETFNGPQGGKPRIERIHVVADTSRSTILIKATRHDLQMIQTLLEILDGSTESPDRSTTNIELIPVRHADAVAVARSLDVAFNGPDQATADESPTGNRPTTSTNKGAPESALGNFDQLLREMFGSHRSPRSRVERIDVVAVPALNAVLVRATPLDRMTIRRLLEEG